jgi:DNA-binding transcriptional LysR family regulator
MDIRHMRQLAAIHSLGSLAKAADALGISQPSLSTSMARLEDELKVKLFDRSAKGSKLTPIGELIVERATKVVSETEEILRDASLIAGGEAGEIRIGVSTALKETFLDRFVVRLANSYPALKMQVIVSDRNWLIPLVRRRELDIAIFAYGDDVAVDDFVSTDVLTAPACAVAAPGHPLVSEKSVSVERFAKFPGAGSIHTQFTNAALLGAEEQAALLHYRSNDYQALIGLALEGRATLIAPRFVVEPFLMDGRLRTIDLNWSFEVTFSAISTRAASYSPIVRQVVEHAAALGAELQRTALARQNL